MAMRSVSACVRDYGAIQSMIFSEATKHSKCLLLLKI